MSKYSTKEIWSRPVVDLDDYPDVSYLPYLTKEQVDGRRLKLLARICDAYGNPEYFEEFHSESAEPQRIPNPEYQSSQVAPGVHYRDVQYTTPELSTVETCEGNANLLALWLLVIGLSIGALAVLLQSVIVIGRWANS